jgi:subtilase family serine protease
MPDNHSNYRVLEHSYRRPRAGARRTGATNPNELFTVSVRVRRAPGAAALPDLADLAATPQGQRQYLSREDFARNYGASTADLDAVAQFAAASGLQVVESSIPRRIVVLKGTAAQMSTAFQVELSTYETAEETYRGREGDVQVPALLVDIVEGIFGLDNRKMAAPQLKRNGLNAAQASPAQATVPLTPPQVAQLYNFPTAPNAAGQTIGILEFGGGYLLSDLQLFYNSVHVPLPSITAVSIDGQTNSPGNDGYTTETLLDVGVAGSAAPGAKLAVYFAPWSEQGWVDAVTTAIHDTVNRPSVITISYGWPENETIDGLSWSLAAIRAVNATFQEAALLGVTVFVSAGDHGSDCGIGDKKAHVLYPGSDPYITSCGGTSISNVSGLNFTEHVWNDNDNDWLTGGGVSDIFYPPNFPMPVWQAWAGAPGSANDGHKARTIPDIAGNADGASGYSLFQNGQNIGAVGGTSATAPLYAALAALLNASLGEPVGFLNVNLYAMPYSYVFRDINDGISNARGGAPGYKSGPGYDACTGLGSINGVAWRMHCVELACLSPWQLLTASCIWLGRGWNATTVFSSAASTALPGRRSCRCQTSFRAAAWHLPSMPASSTWPGRACWATRGSITRTSMELRGRRSSL